MAKILLVEDNEMNRDMLSRRLARRGYEVVIAVDGEQGVAMARSEAPALILMDMSLPGLDGWEATRQIKAAPATRTIPVIALTAHAMAGDREKAHRGRLRRLRHQAGRLRPAAREDRGAARAVSRRVSIDPAAQLRHELRTPLNHIIGYTELLLEELAAGGKPELTAGLTALRIDARQLLTLLNEVLARGRRGARSRGRPRNLERAPRPHTLRR